MTRIERFAAELKERGYAGTTELGQLTAEAIFLAADCIAFVRDMDMASESNVVSFPTAEAEHYKEAARLLRMLRPPEWGKDEWYIDQAAIETWILRDYELAGEKNTEA